MKITRVLLPILTLGMLLTAFNEADAEPRPVPTPVADFSGDTINFGFDVNDTVLTAEQQAVIENSHFLALQQVRAAIQYLNVFSNNIVEGNNELYNNTFGRFYDTNATTNTLLGQYSQTTTGVLLGATLAQSNGVTNSTVRFAANTPYNSSLLFVGDEVFLDGERYFVTRLNTRNATNQVPFETIQSLILDRNYNGTTNTPLVQRIEGETEVIDPAHYQRVLDIFTQIESLLAQDTNYYGDLSVTQAQNIYNTIFTVGRSQISPDAESNTPILSDRGVRQFGFSNSNSALHLDQLLNDPDNPLFWVDDNADLLDADGNPLPGHQIFFNDELTAIANGSDVLVGGAFLSELETIGDLFDGTVQTEQGQTELAQYQQLIAAFAENAVLDQLTFFETDSTNTTQGSAAFGIQEVLDLLGTPQGSADNPHPQNVDASNFATFANIFSDPALATGIGDGTTLPPIGKNGESFEPGAFTPAVPRN